MSLMDQAAQAANERRLKARDSARDKTAKDVQARIDFVQRATGIEPEFVERIKVSRFLPGTTGSWDVPARSATEEVVWASIFTVDDVKVAIHGNWPSYRGGGYGDKMSFVFECPECHRVILHDQHDLHPRTERGSTKEYVEVEIQKVIDAVARAMESKDKTCTFCEAACPERCVTCGQDWVR